MRRETGPEIYECDAVRCSKLLVFLLLFLIPVLSSAALSQEPEIPSAVSSQLSAQIAGESSEAKRSALSEIRNLRSASASRLALPALRDKDPIVRATAAGSVVFLPKTEASRALIPLVSDKAEFVRRESAFALGKVRDSAATSALIRLMQTDKVLEVRTAAAIALGEIGDPAAVESLIAILKTRPREEDEFLRRSAARSIGQIAQITLTGEPSVLTPQNFLPEKFKELGPVGPSPQHPQFSGAIDLLIGVLGNASESDDTRREAAFSLGAIGDPRATATLQRYVSSPDPYLAEIIREALLKIERRRT